MQFWYWLAQQKERGDKLDVSLSSLLLHFFFFFFSFLIGKSGCIKSPITLTILLIAKLVQDRLHISRILNSIFQEKVVENLFLLSHLMIKKYTIALCICNTMVIAMPDATK